MAFYALLTQFPEDLVTFTEEILNDFLCSVNFFRILTVCSYHVRYTFQSESTLYSCLNVKELLGRNRREIRSLGDCNGTRTNNHLVYKRKVNHLVKLVK